MATSGNDNNPVGDREVDSSESVKLAFHRDALLFFQSSKLQPLFSTFAAQLGEHTAVAC